MDTSVFTFLFLICVSLASSGLIDYCGYDYGKMQHGKLNLDDVDVYNTVKGMRSKVECATSCYADIYCRTAVYQFSGNCLLITNFTSKLEFSENSHPDEYSDVVLQMRSIEQHRASGSGGSFGFAECPSECTGYSVCVVDCTFITSSDAGQDGLEAVCMDISTTQYTDDSCGFQPHLQSKEYYLQNLDRDSNSNGYTYFTVTFVKLESWTTLRVKFRGTLRGGYGGGGGWGRWRILFNGGHCGNPGWIESINYNEESNTDHQKATGIIGICYGLSAGSYSVTLNVEMHSSYFRVGYNTHASRLYIDEIAQATWSGEPAVHPCPSLPAFNTREHVSTSSWGNEPTVTLWNVGYTKMEAATWLRINLDFVIRNYAGGSSTSRCATWYVLIDGGHCQPHPMGKTLANLNYANEVNNEHRSVEVEGHCSGVSAGYHTIGLQLAGCPWGTGWYDTYTGWNGCRQRFIIEEIRKETNIVGVMASNGQDIYRIPQFNMVTHSQGHPARGEDNAVVWSIPAYNKLYTSSGLQLTLSADGRCYSGHGQGGWSHCCRHYFVINGAECNDPGTIEGIHYLNKRTNLHRPIMIEGICEGIASGPVTLTLNAGRCRHDGHDGECYYGWNSYTHLMISEAYVDREIIAF